MNQEKICDVVQDLLPLYQDGICSEESKEIVQKHLQECPKCREIAYHLKNSYVEEQLINEKKGILRVHAQKEKKRTTMVGMITAGVLLVPIIVCLICNLSIGKALDWFYIVLASLMVFASVTVVPLLVERNRGMWTLGSFVLTFIVLLGTICLYTKGKWFFIATVPSLFGLSIVFLPFVLYKINLSFLHNTKGLIYMIINTAFLYLVIYTCSFYTDSILYNRIAYGITTFCLVFIWIIFFVIRYLPIQSLSKVGVVTMLSGIFLPIVDQFIDYLIYDNVSYVKKVNLFAWSLNNLEANIYAIVVGICVIVGINLIVFGSRKSRK